MAKTKILNLASFEDVETLKQTTKSQGEEISQVKSDLSDIDSSIFYEEISTEKKIVDATNGIGSLSVGKTYADLPFGKKSKVTKIKLKSKLPQTNPEFTVYIIGKNGTVKEVVYDGIIQGSFSSNAVIDVPVDCVIDSGEYFAIYSNSVIFSIHASDGKYGSYNGNVNIGDNPIFNFNDNYSLSIGYEYYEFYKKEKIKQNRELIDKNKENIESASRRIDALEQREVIKSPLTYFDYGVKAVANSAVASTSAIIVNKHYFDEKIYIKRMYLVTAKNAEPGEFTAKFYDIDQNYVPTLIAESQFNVTSTIERIEFELNFDFELKEGHRIGVYSGCKLCYMYNQGEGMDWYSEAIDGFPLETPSFSTDSHTLALGLDYAIGIKNVISYDVFLCCGQSNMAGRGDAENAPTLIDGAGLEYRTVSDDTKLYPISEPFGKYENDKYIFNLGAGNVPYLSGSMVTAFANAYYKATKTPIIAIASAQGGTSSEDWLPNGTKMTGALLRLTKTKNWLERMNYTVRNTYVLWCQGETDGDNSVDVETYKSNVSNIIESFISAGVDKVFMIRIGNCNIEGSYDRYKYIINAQNEIAKTNPNVVMVSCDFAGMRERGLMKDNFHYYQEGYNECGTYAGVNTAFYVNNGKEPTMYDTEYGSLYFSHKN